MLETLRQDARAIFDAALEAADPTAAVHRAVRVEGTHLEVAGHACDLAAVSYTHLTLPTTPYV